MYDEAFFASPDHMFLFWKRISFVKLTEKSNMNWDFDIDIKLQHANFKLNIYSNRVNFALSESFLTFNICRVVF